LIFAIESSCDESALARFDPRHGIRGEWLHSQVSLHSSYGGVVPDLASREHLQRFPPLLAHALGSGHPGITRLAVTTGPGLAGCLAVGIALAQALSLAWSVPVIPVNHLRAHAFSPFIPLHAQDPDSFDARLAQLLPHLGLLVSGGNTLLFVIEAGPGGGPSLRLIGQTRDDAAGEALDKGAKLLGMPYPGGPFVEKAARTGDPARFVFPRTRLKNSHDFSFSGLKTSLRYRLEKYRGPDLDQDLPDLCAAYQHAVIDQLAAAVARALDAQPGRFRSLGLSGGVANNQALRETLLARAAAAGIPLLAALPAHCGDNAAMIAFAAWLEPLATPAGSPARLAFAPGISLHNEP